jgi:hypothetical protein
MTVDTFYIDGHNGISDPNGVWANDANAFDGNTGTSASSSTTGSTNYLEGDGTNASSITDTILAVRFRVYGSGILSLNLSLDNFATTIFSNAVNLSSSPSAYQTLPVPSGGWTSSQVQNMQAKFSAGIGLTTVAKIEIEVSHATAYTYPIMIANTASLAAATSARGLPIQATSDVGWGTNSI